MKKNGKLTALMALCLVVLIAAAALGVRNLFGYAGVSYADAKNYTAGDAEITGPVRRIEISWTNGRVELAYHSGSTVLVSEKANKPLSEKQRLRWWLDGDTLKIQYARSGLRLNWNIQKELTVTLPEGTDLESLDIGATSGDVSIPALNAGTLSVGVTSGDVSVTARAAQISCASTSGAIRLTAQEGAEKISISATSGCVGLNVPDGTDTVSIGTTSGNVILEAGKVNTVNVSTTSGTISAVIAGTEDIRLHTTSGNIHADLAGAEKTQIESTSGTADLKIGKLSSLKVNTTSGDVTAALGTDPGFTANLHATSGRITHELPLSQSDKNYVCGDGSGSVTISTTSGNILIKGLEE